MPTIKAALLALGLLSLPALSAAQASPNISATMRQMLAGLPLAEAKDELQGMVGTLRQTSCGGGLTGCYATQTEKLQLYFFTSGQAQQTFLVVVNRRFPLPKLLGPNVQRVLGDTAVSSPMISISTTEYSLPVAKMPAGLRNVVRDHYFDVPSLTFSSGVQLAARAELGGMFKQTMAAFGVTANQLTMRAAVVMPIPTDFASGANAGAAAASAAQQGQTMQQAGAQALSPEAFVEFQFGPNFSLPLTMPPVNLTDATFFLNNALTFGYKGNANFAGVSNKPVLIHFQTPLNPAGALDLLDFQFLMATPASFTMEDAARVMVAMASPDLRLAKYGGGFVRDINQYRSALLSAAQPLSAFKFTNPQPVGPYRFGDSTKPFPTNVNAFNIVLEGPTAPDGPFIRLAGDATILGMRMGSISGTAGLAGLKGRAMYDLKLPLGPLGEVTVQQMLAEANVDKDNRQIRVRGNYLGQVVEAILNGNQVTAKVEPNCVNPFKIETTVTVTASTTLANVLRGQAGVNVDPTKIGNCTAQQIEAALRMIGGEYKNLSGYTAAAANAELKRMGLAASKEYEDAKNTLRNTANQASNAANQALKEAENVFKGFGKKKKHKKGPDPRFASSVFDWDYYYDNHPDVVAEGTDLATYWRDTGFAAGQRGSLEFNVKFYRRRYLDVQALCSSTDYQCALQHWLDMGLRQGRQGSADVSVDSYIKNHKDVRDAYGADGYEDAMEHWLSVGADKGSSAAPEGVAGAVLVGSQQIGGGGGGPWTDGVTCAGQHVTGWRLYAGRLIDRVQFKYPGGWAPAHGSNAEFNAEVVLPAGQYIVQVDYRAGDKVDSLSFRTNTGVTYGPYGGGGGGAGTYKVQTGQKLGCMSGRSGSLTDQLTFTSTGER